MAVTLEHRQAVLRDAHAVERQRYPGQNARPRLLLIVALLSAAFLYLQVFIPLSTPILLPGDQLIYLHDATRMLDGQLIYRDYHHFTFPGTDVLYLTLFRVFGVRAWIDPAMLVLVGLLSACVVTVISRRLLSDWAALLPGLLFVTVPFAAYLDAAHRWYSTLFSITALALLMEKYSAARLIWAGILIGLATFFTQSAALVAIGFALFLLWEHWQAKRPWKTLVRREALLLFSFAATIAACLAYFVRSVGFKKFFYFTMVFPVKYYPAEWFNTWRVYLHGRPLLHHPSTWTNGLAFVLIQLIVPFIYVPFLIALLRKRPSIPEEQRTPLMLISITGLFLFISVANAPAASRLCMVSAPAIILLVWFADLQMDSRVCFRLLWATVILLAIVRPLATELQRNGTLDLPIGRTAFLDSAAYEKCKWMAQRTRPSDSFFNDPEVAFALRLRNVSEVPTVSQTDYTRPEEVQTAVDALERFQVRFVDWRHELDDKEDAPRWPGGDHLGPLRLYLREHYHRAITFSNRDQIWERNP